MPTMLATSWARVIFSLTWMFCKGRDDGGNDEQCQSKSSQQKANAKASHVQLCEPPMQCNFT